MHCPLLSFNVIIKIKLVFYFDHSLHSLRVFIRIGLKMGKYKLKMCTLSCGIFLTCRGEKWDYSFCILFIHTLTDWQHSFSLDIPACHHEVQYTKNKRTFRIPMRGLFLTCTENSFLFLTHIKSRGCVYAIC
jgi:hypothetical protein